MSQVGPDQPRTTGTDTPKPPDAYTPTTGAKMTGLSWRESAAVGILMNTRGLVELIVLNIGLEAKVITDKLFTILVMMVSFVACMCA